MLRELNESLIAASLSPEHRGPLPFRTIPARVLGRWTFDEGSGDVALSAGDGPDLSLRDGAAWTADGARGGALELAGGAYAETGSLVSLYVDGQHVGSEKTGRGARGRGAFRVGGGAFDPGEPFLGSVDDLVVFDPALTSEEARLVFLYEDAVDPSFEPPDEGGGGGCRLGRRRGGAAPPAGVGLVLTVVLTVDRARRRRRRERPLVPSPLAAQRGADSCRRRREHVR